MPISSGNFASYVTTSQEFEVHWTGVNSTRPQPLVLKSGVAEAQLAEMRSALQDRILGVSEATTLESIAASTYKTARAAVYDAMKTFRAGTGYELQGTAFLSSVPTLPRETANDNDLKKVRDKIITLWTQINLDPAFPTGLVLRGGLSQGAFQLLAQTLDDAGMNMTAVQMTAESVRQNRDDLLAPLKAVLMDYAKAIRALYAPDSPQVQTLPVLTARSRPTPGGVTNFQAIWDAALQKAALSWTLSTDPDIVRQAVMSCSGPRWKEADAQNVGDLTPEIVSFDTDAGFPQPGATVWFKVLVFRDDGQYKSSAAVKVTRV